jgi:hypothetical protein
MSAHTNKLQHIQQQSAALSITTVSFSTPVTAMPVY